MCSADLLHADTLRQIAGWNQRPADWQRFLDLSPRGCFVAEAAHHIIGTVTTIQYDRKVAWIGMLLVDPNFRSHGIGKALLTHAIEHLQSEHIPSIKLDATPLGESLYRKMGFRDEWALTRYRAVVSGRLDEVVGPVLDLTNENAHQAIELDAQAFGIRRPELIESLLLSAKEALAITNARELDAFGLLRSGSVADYLGPVVARTKVAATEIILELCRRAGDRPVYWDIPMPNEAALALAKKLGFQAERPLLRMYLGRNDHPGDVAKYLGIADPSLG
jgi:GNAT superfamily N-acetyltransferase